MGKFNEYSQKATPADNDTLMIYDATAKANKLSPFSGIWNWIVGKLTNAVISNLQTSNKTVIGALNELNSKSFSVSNTVTDVSQLDGVVDTNIAYVSGAIIEEKSVYGFAITTSYGPVISQIVFGSFSGVSGIAIRGKSGSPLNWKSWKVL